MTGWLYLIKNRDLYKIGITKNFDNRMRQLKPDNVIAKLQTNNYMKLERELHHRYKKFRIPQTEYFRLDKTHIKEIKQQILFLDYPKIINFWLLIKSFLYLLAVFSLIYIFMYLTINDLNIVLAKSFLWTERISISISFFSLFIHSGIKFSYINELKYRITRTFFFSLFSCFIWIFTAF
tara:strand:+ start:236 stop:772 length:537 start_codon:yes stop_codon:yes gene_type:complete